MEGTAMKIANVSNLVLGKMINAAKVIASQLKDIKLADRLDVSMVSVQRGKLIASMTLLAIPAKKPAPALARMNVRAHWVVSLLYISVHPNFLAALSLVEEVVMIPVLKSVNVALALSVISLFYLKELLILLLSMSSFLWQF
jgi:hypothetical protein